ncbi:MAG: GNAT family N-acetyltransferase [Paenisporosarcina sp.]
MFKLIINNSMLKIVNFDINDIPDLITLSESVGWDYDIDEIQTILKSGTAYGHRNQFGEVVSSAAIIKYGSSLATIGMVIVHPDYRGLGLGKTVTQVCLDSVLNTQTVMLVATEDGRPMYEKMGFVAIDYIHKYICNNYQPLLLEDNVSFTIEKIESSWMPKIIELDKFAFGEDRTSFLTLRIAQSKEALAVRNSLGEIVGFGLSIVTPTNLILGPIVAPDSEVASHLIHRLAGYYQEKLRIDVPSGNAKFISYIESCGFVKVNQPPIMIKNADQLPIRNETLYGIAAQIFG